jgi:hypothetical protein
MGQKGQQDPVMLEGQQELPPLKQCLSQTSPPASLSDAADHVVDFLLRLCAEDCGGWTGCAMAVPAVV